MSEVCHARGYDLVLGFGQAGAAGSDQSFLSAQVMDSKVKADFEEELSERLSSLSARDRQAISVRAALRTLPMLWNNLGPDPQVAEPKLLLLACRTLIMAAVEST
ncbi:MULTISPECIES: hypothetical protein, partial [unclassified Phaeobacter]